MAFFGKNFFALFAICVALYTTAADRVRTQKWDHDFGNSVYQQDRSSLTSPGQVYGNCNPQLVDMVKDKFKTSCKFAMEIADAPIDSPDHVRMCDFTLTKDIPNSGRMYMLEKIVAVTKDRAVVQFEGSFSQIIFVLNFANCTVANSYTDNNYMSVYAPTEDKFDVIVLKYKNPDEKLRIVFDADGNIKSNEQSWFKSDASIISAADSPTKGRVVVDLIRKFIDHDLKPSVRINTVANDGSIETLKEYPIDDKGFFSHWKRFVESTTFNLVSLCARLNATTPMKCSQVDLDGKVKFEVEISLDEYAPVYSFRLHNLPGGGLLLFIHKCDAKVKPVCILKEQSFVVKKINAVGQVVGTMKVNENNDKLSVTMGAIHTFESDKKEICLSNVRSKSNNWKLTLDIVCLKDDDFSGEISWPTY